MNKYLKTICIVYILEKFKKFKKSDLKINLTEMIQLSPLITFIQKIFKNCPIFNSSNIIFLTIQSSCVSSCINSNCKSFFPLVQKLNLLQQHAVLDHPLQLNSIFFFPKWIHCWTILTRCKYCTSTSSLLSIDSQLNTL